MISVPPRPFCHRVSTRSSGDRLPWCPSRTPRRTVPSDSNLVSIPVLSRLVRKRSTPLPTPRTRRIEQTLVGCPCGHFPKRRKRVWAPYSRPDAHPPLRTLEIVVPTQIQWQNHVTTQPRRHQRLHCHTHEGGRGHSGLQNTQRDLKGRLGPPPEARRPCRKALIDFHRGRGNMNYETQNYSGNLECQRYSKLEGFRLGGQPSLGRLVRVNLSILK